MKILIKNDNGITKIYEDFTDKGHLLLEIPNGEMRIIDICSDHSVSDIIISPLINDNINE